MSTRNTAAWVHGVSQYAKNQNCTCTRSTCFKSTVGLLVPVLNPTTQMDGLSVCWCCGKPGHLKAFCTAKLIHEKEADQLNVSFVAIGIRVLQGYGVKCTGF